MNKYEEVLGAAVVPAGKPEKEKGLFGTSLQTKDLAYVAVGGVLGWFAKKKFGKKR